MIETYRDWIAAEGYDLEIPELTPPAKACPS